MWLVVRMQACAAPGWAAMRSDVAVEALQAWVLAHKSSRQAVQETFKGWSAAPKWLGASLGVLLCIDHWAAATFAVSAP